MATATVSSRYASPINGTHLVSGSWDRTVRVWSLATHAAVCEPLVHPHSVNSVSVRGAMLATSWDNVVRLWSLLPQVSSCAASHLCGVNYE